VTDFSDVTELAGASISAEQLERMSHRYHWAMSQCRGKDVVEVACGSGQGLGLLAAVAASLEAGDCSDAILRIPRDHYGTRILIVTLDAEALPYADQSKDVIVFFEALYYLPHPERFVAECARVLRVGGDLLIVTANKDLWDFHPSPHSHQYFGVVELGELLSRHGFGVQFFGFQPVAKAPLRQRLLRPFKRLAVASGFMPKTMAGKRWLRRIVFGAQVPMPAELTRSHPGAGLPLHALDAGMADRDHKIIYCAAKLAA
jgi:SAM-dependent methyltransferase